MITELILTTLPLMYQKDLRYLHPLQILLGHLPFLHHLLLHLADAKMPTVHLLFLRHAVVGSLISSRSKGRSDERVDRLASLNLTLYLTFLFKDQRFFAKEGDPMTNGLWGEGLPVPDPLGTLEFQGAVSVKTEPEFEASLQPPTQQLRRPRRNLPRKEEIWESGQNHRCTPRRLGHDS